MDRRIQKTRQAIITAFIELLTEKGFERITINDIAERANVNRGTVYLHFQDKYDLLDQCMEAHIEPLIRHCANAAEPNSNATVLRSMFDYLERHIAIYKLFLGNETAGFFRKRIYTIISQALDLGALMPKSRAHSPDATTHFIAAGFIGVLEWWVSNTMPCTAGEITEQLMFMVEPLATRLGSGSIDKW